jgi:hypothetical protein
MVQHIGLVVAQVTNGVFSVMRVLEGADPKVREAIQIKDFLEIAYLVV